MIVVACSASMLRMLPDTHSKIITKLQILRILVPEVRFPQVRHLRQIGAVCCPSSPVWWMVAVVPILERRGSHSKEWVIRWAVFFSPAVHDRWRWDAMEVRAREGGPIQGSTVTDWIQPTNAEMGLLMAHSVVEAMHGEVQVASEAQPPHRVLVPPLIARAEYLSNFEASASFAVARVGASKKPAAAVGSIIRYAPWVLLDARVRQLACEALGLNRVFSPLWETAMVVIAAERVRPPGHPVEVPVLDQDASFLEACRSLGRPHGDRRGTALQSAIPDLIRADNGLRRWNSRARRRFVVPIIARIPGERFTYGLGADENEVPDVGVDRVVQSLELFSADDLPALRLIGAGGIQTNRILGSTTHLAPPPVIPLTHREPPVLTLRAKGQSRRTAPSPD